jgi:eukaryotic-like serine/threonine-protein kinase
MNIRPLFAAGAVFALVAATTASGQATFRGDAARSGAQPDAAPREFHRVKWSFPTGDKVVSSPALDAGTLYFGSDDGHLYAVDAASGRQRWKARTGGPVPSTPAIAGGRVFVASYDGRIHAFDAASGEVIWRFATGGERRFEARGLHGMQPRQQTFADPYDVFLSSPLVVGGTVYVGSGDGHLYALDAASGDLRWKFRADDVIHASPAYAEGLVFIGSWDGRLYAVDAKTGRERWRFQAGLDPLLHNQQGFQGSPAVAEGTVYVGCRDAHLYAIDAHSGQEKWRFATAQSWVVASPAVAGGRVVFATSDSSLVHVVDAASGKPLLQLQAKSYMFSSPTVAGDVLLIGEINGTLQARDLTSGAPLWEFRTEASRANAGWVLTADGRLNSPWLFPSAWRESTAVAFERQSSVGSIFSTPLVAGGTVYVGSADGRMYAIE